MDTIKVATGISGSILILLIAVLAFTKNPEKQLYDKTVESLMAQQGMSTQQEVMHRFPELYVVKSKMERIGHLNRTIHSLTSGPSPNVSEGDDLRIQEYSEEIKRLQNSVKRELKQLIATQVAYQP